MKIRRDARDDEGDQKEIECVERPPEEARDEGLIQRSVGGEGDGEGEGGGEALGEGVARGTSLA